MKAVVQTAYGEPDILQIEDVARPTPADDEVRVRVHAAGVNSWDWGNQIGAPFITRMLAGLRKPRRPVPGCDIAGVVDAVGSAVTSLRVGDEVFGDLSARNWGAFAEYVCARPEALVVKPAALSFEDAAALPQAGVMALQGVRDYGDVQPGQRVLVNGAGGGVGTFAIQLARQRGAHVTGVDTAAKFEVMREAGANDVIDYRETDYTRTGHTWDFILDNHAHQPANRYAASLSPGGAYVMVGGLMRRLPGILAQGAWCALTGRKRLRVLAHAPNRGLAELADMVVGGDLRVFLDGRYGLADAPRALAALGAGEVRGKAVLSIAEAPAGAAYCA